MALGRRKREQQALLVATTSLPQSPGHPFYQKLNRLLAEAQFDEYVEGLCRALVQRFWTPVSGDRVGVWQRSFARQAHNSLSVVARK